MGRPVLTPITTQFWIPLYRRRGGAGIDLTGKRAVVTGASKTPEQGAATVVLFATSPDLEGIGGRYFNDCNEAPTVDHRDADGTGVASYALDPANAHRLRDVSKTLLPCA
jgi:hypothetical protein